MSKNTSPSCNDMYIENTKSFNYVSMYNDCNTSTNTGNSDQKWVTDYPNLVAFELSLI